MQLFINQYILLILSLLPEKPSNSKVFYVHSWKKLQCRASTDHDIVDALTFLLSK